MNRRPIYKIGDKVKIVKYGHPIWQHKKCGQPMMRFPLIKEDENIWWLDMTPQIVGQTGIVSQATITQGMPKYAIDGIKEKHAWYSEDQMEMINQQ